MLTAVSRYGVRLAPDADDVFHDCERRGELVTGPLITAFERLFIDRFGGGNAIATSYGRTAFFHIVRAMRLPAGSEIILPALTFWVIPEIARRAGLRPVFVDVDPLTFTMDPDAFEAAITPDTVAVVPTHLYGLPCDMQRIMEISRRHRLLVIEDCAHALGATYRGTPVGTFGDAAFFSFQNLKPLGALGGGMAVVADGAIAARVREDVGALGWPDDQRVRNRFKIARAMRFFTRPWPFTLSAFPFLWLASWQREMPDLSARLWEQVRPLEPFPNSYPQRFPNAQAAIGLAGLRCFDEWTAASRRHASVLDAALTGHDDIERPFVPADRTHVYYQYCAYVPNRDEVVRHCIRRGVDVETLHVDVCTRLPLFAAFVRAPAPGADRAATAVQVPVYATLSERQVRRVARTLLRAVAPASRTPRIGRSGRAANGRLLVSGALSR